MTLDRYGEALAEHDTLYATSRRARALTTAADDTSRTPDEIVAHCAGVLRILRATGRQVQP